MKTVKQILTIVKGKLESYTNPEAMMFMCCVLDELRREDDITNQEHEVGMAYIRNNIPKEVMDNKDIAAWMLDSCSWYPTNDRESRLIWLNKHLV